jgi:hypothetical protein
MKFTSLSVKAVCLALPQFALAAAGSLVTKSFSFKQDYYLKVCPLSNAIGPDNVDILMSALEQYSIQFSNEWGNQLKMDLHNGTCSVDVSTFYRRFANICSMNLQLTILLPAAGHQHS